MNKRRWLKILLAVFFVLVSSLPVMLWWIINSETASVGVVQEIFSLLKQQMSVTTIQGRLRDELVLENFEYHNDSQAVTVKKLRLRWQLSDLFSKQLKISELKIDGVTVLLLETPPEENDFDPLAKIELPIQVSIDDFLLTNLRIEQEEKSYQVDKVQFSAATVGKQLQIHSLKVEGEGVSAHLTGKTQLGEGFAFRMKLDWQFNGGEQGQWRGVLSATGNSEAVSFNNQLLAPFSFIQQGQVTDLMGNPTVQTTGEWKKLRWPLTGQLIQIFSEKGRFTVAGNAQQYQVAMQAQLSQQQLAQAQLQFNGTGTTENFSIAQLDLRSKLGQLQLNGEIGWKNAPHFDLVALGSHFNPAIVMPEMVGDLNFKTHLTGQLLAEKLQLAVLIEYLKGRLRNYPVLAQGQLNLVDKQLEIKALSLASGANTLSAHGQLGETQARLEVKLAAPELKTLWKGLGGQLNATAHLQGALTDPSLRLEAKGKQLHFAEHTLTDLTMAVNYAADKKTRSTLQVNAAGLQSGATQIKRFTLTGQGLPAQHQFTAQVDAPEGTVQLALTGALKNTDWQARLTQLILTQPQAGRWQLNHPSVLTINKQAAGVDVKLTESCFTQAAARLCLEGSYPVSGQFQGAVHASLPSALAKPYLPPTVKFHGQLAVAAKVQKNTAGLTGQYQLSLSPDSQVAVTVDKQVTTIPFNKLAVTGVLRGTQLESVLDVVFAQKNSLHGQLRLDTGKSQAMAGQFSAAIMDFAPLAPYVLPLTDLKGNLTAALTVAGSLKKPSVTGAVSLNNAAVAVNEAGLNLHDVQLKLSSPIAAAEQMLITGSAKSGTGQLNLNGTVQLNPALGFPAQLKITGNDFEVVKLPEANIAISPELVAHYEKNAARVSGKVSLSKLQIELKQLPANALKPSEDEQIVGAEKPTHAEAPKTKVALDIDLDLGKKAHFSGFGMATDLQGALKLTQKNEALVMFGSVEMSKARYKSYGQDLTVRRGKFVFNGAPSNPLLDVQAIRLSKSKKVTAILQVSGELKAPKTRIYAEPAQPESDALAYLITGNALNQLTKAEGNMLASAALSYGAGHLSWLTEKFGIDELELQEGETMKESVLALGQYLTPDLYVGAKVGLFNKQTAMVVKYKISEDFSVTSQAGESQRVHFNYEFSHN